MSALSAVVDVPQPSMAPVRPPPRVEVRNLGLWRGQRVVLDDICLTADPGEVVAILGPNGCGKTSIIECIVGLCIPSRGSVWLDGQQQTAATRLARSRVGIVFQQTSLDARLSVEDNLLLAAALLGIRGAEARQRARELLAFMELEDRRGDPVEILSGGLRRRLELARALIHRPSLLLLDEPTTGLDPHACERFWRRVSALRRSEDLAILLTTSRATEAERCDRVVVIDRGHVVACDTPSRLLMQTAADIVEIEAERAEQLVEEIFAELGLRAHALRNRVLLECEAGHLLVPRLIETLPCGRLQSVSVRRPTLADALFKLTGRALDEEGGEP